jgi:hypothetical protein
MNDFKQQSERIKLTTVSKINCGYSQISKGNGVHILNYILSTLVFILKTMLHRVTMTENIAPLHNSIDLI